MGDISEHFNRSEFACKCGCGFNTVDVELIYILELVRSKFRKPVKINSGNRCEEHNIKVGGSPNSQHLFSKAADIVVEDTEPWRVYNYLNRTFIKMYGLGFYGTFIHIDVRKNESRW